MNANAKTCPNCGAVMSQKECSSPYIAPTENFPEGLYSIWYEWECPLGCHEIPEPDPYKDEKDQENSLAHGQG